MANYYNRYFDETLVEDWSVLHFHKSWIDSYSKTPEQLSYAKAMDAIIKSLNSIAQQCPDPLKIKRANELLSEIQKNNQRRTGSNMDKLWLRTEKNLREKVETNTGIKNTGTKNTGTNIQIVSCNRIKIGSVGNSEKENKVESVKKRALETKSNEDPRKRSCKQDPMEKEEYFSSEYNGQELDRELFLEETNKEYDVENSEHPSNYDEWTLKSGLSVINLLKVAAGITGHLMRPEVWGIVRCGLNVAKPKWCNEEEYDEIQKTIKRRSIINPPEFVLRLLKNKSLVALGQELNRIKIKELMKQNDDLEEIKQLSLIPTPPDAMTSFFVKILSRFHQFIFPQQSIMQQIGVSEASYGAHIIHPCFIELLSGDDHLLYEPGEIVLSSIKSCCDRRKCEPFEQKADGRFLARLQRSCIEIGHLEMSGGYGHREISRSTWDGCCKGPLGNMYMLEEIGERYQKASPKSFAKTRVFFVHTHEDKIELWQMHNRARGILQWERTHKAIVPICYEEQKKYLFDFVVLLWDLKEGLINTVNMIRQLQDEDNDGIFKLSGRLPPHPGKPDKESSIRED